MLARSLSTIAAGKDRLLTIRFCPIRDDKDVMAPLTELDNLGLACELYEVRMPRPRSETRGHDHKAVLAGACCRRCLTSGPCGGLQREA